MKKLFRNERLLLVALLMLTAAVGIFGTACKGKPVKYEPGDVFEPGTYGEGSRSFAFDVVNEKGETASFTIRTDREYVGEALQDAGLIQGEQGEYGLYVKAVNGTTADYDLDQSYWSFMIDGEYAVTGADLTPVEEGKTYSFVYTK